MRKLLPLVIVLIGLRAEAQPAPTFPASQAQVDAGTVFAPFYVTPLTLQNKAGNSGITSSQLTAALLAGTNVLSLTNAASATLPVTAADSSWMSITNAVAITNQPTTIGQALVVVGTNQNGATLVKGTNWPSGGGLTSVATTNQIWYDTNTITHTSVLKDTNGVWTFMTNGTVVARIDLNTGTITATNFTANGPNTNYFGDTLFQNRLFAVTNAAGVTNVTQATLHTLAINKGWTNDLGGKATFTLQLTLTNGATAASWPTLAFTNSINGMSLTNRSFHLLASATNVDSWTSPLIAPGDTGSLSNYGPVGSVIINSGTWQLQ